MHLRTIFLHCLLIKFKLWWLVVNSISLLVSKNTPNAWIYTTRMKIGATVSLRIHLIDINYCCEKLVTPIDNNIEFLNISNNGIVDKWRNEVTCGLSIEYYLRMSIVLNFPQLEIKANACQGFWSNVCGLI